MFTNQRLVSCHARTMCIDLGPIQDEPSLSEVREGKIVGQHCPRFQKSHHISLRDAMLVYCRFQPSRGCPFLSTNKPSHPLEHAQENPNNKQ